AQVPAPDDIFEALASLSMQELATRIAHRNTGKLIGDQAGQDVMLRVGNDEGDGVVDFQTVPHACGAQDLAYFIGAGLTTDVRREHERALVQRWVEGLRGYSVAITPDDAWLEYRKFTFAGFVMAVVASMIVKQTDRGDEMFLAMANRHGQHAVDLDSLAAVRN
ncbi:MAG: hypothetical protein ACKODN_11650, partial [Actinomycetota bacterium]